MRSPELCGAKGLIGPWTYTWTPSEPEGLRIIASPSAALPPGLCGGPDLVASLFNSRQPGGLTADRAAIAIWHGIMGSGGRCTRPNAAGLARSAGGTPHNSGLRIIPAAREALELRLHERRQRPRPLLAALEELREVATHQHRRCRPHGSAGCAPGTGASPGARRGTAEPAATLQRQETAMAAMYGLSVRASADRPLQDHRRTVVPRCRNRARARRRGARRPWRLRPARLLQHRPVDERARDPRDLLAAGRPRSASATSSKSSASPTRRPASGRPSSAPRHSSASLTRPSSCGSPTAPTPPRSRPHRRGPGSASTAG